MSTVYAKQYGRLGNNLFQKAAAIGYAKKNSIEYSLLSPIAFARLASPTTLDIREQQHNYQELYYEPGWRNVVLNGYWQSEKYFYHCREEVLKAFDFNWLPVFPETCAIHVRRGDYLLYPHKHPVVTSTYIMRALSAIHLQTNVTHFKFFSDDIPWCKEWVSEYRGTETFDFSEGLSEKEDLELMSSCQHQIISNSTFSWWGAWLNQNPDKVVVSPSKDNWFGSGNAHLCTDDIIPDSWIQIKY